ncbi:hypothetical protein SPRG_00747 [Saprolegnia parasitica CBS 223.65]|uniref:Transmembrane protein 135 N-terminal domain-containing protein n=1 Tax=Saprolegnia parasitica (strain CBS 223.65) TaxID=695850 RepID=A0A067CW39_SAPPC|nr:hypothetical protein SPRG_00747 [Saprolegnia parasitica CBS 223.65]KDO34683.1 hypothetical protein SPRG_00747 [Saprolegnia parasitica CBS 223.65]|eukprot:XP_012194355.1 hypothetical protein SPRG_00747 [Saprolegnia parasitica CBS 223.65]
MSSSSSVASAAHGAATCVALGSVVASLRARRPAPPSPLFSALAAGCGIFRLLQARSPRVAAGLAAVAFFRLISDAHKHIVLSYALIESALQVYALCPASALLEHATSVAVTSRLMYIYLFRCEWILPSQLKMLDYQSCLPAEILAATRREIRTGRGSRCACFHPNKSCAAFLRDESAKHLVSGAKIFLPIHVVSALLAWKARPIDVRKHLVDYMRSILFLSGNYVFPYTFSCLVPIANHRVAISLATLTPFLAQYFEPAKRRFTIRKAVASYSLITVFYQLKELGVCRKLTRSHVLSAATCLYAACMVWLLEHPEKQNRWLMYGLYGRDVRLPKPPQADIEGKRQATS